MVSQIECNIECNRAPDGRWVAMVDDLPGLQLYGDSQEETLATARKRRVSIALRHSHGEFTDFCLVAAC